MTRQTNAVAHLLTALPYNAGVCLQGGESAGLARLADQLSDKEWVAAFEKPKGNPAAFKKPATTCLSPYLKFGCVSVRLFYSKIQTVRSLSLSCMSVESVGHLAVLWHSG